MPMKYKKYVCLFEKPFKLTEFGFFFKIFFLVYFMQDSFSHIVRLDELVRRHEVHVTGVSSLFQEGLQLCIYLSLLIWSKVEICVFGTDLSKRKCHSYSL